MVDCDGGTEKAENKKTDSLKRISFLLLVRQAWVQFKGGENMPGSGQWMPKPSAFIVRWSVKGRVWKIAGLTNRHHIRHKLGIRLLNKLKSNNYTKSICVNAAGG